MDSFVLTPAEQEYVKHIYLYTQNKEKTIQTKHLASMANTKPSSVTDMVVKLANKGLVVYEKHHGCYLSDTGMKEALQIIRRNRLWELFLCEKLDMDWKEVDETASKLQGLTSPALTEKLSAFLGHPTYDPHGETIPDQKGKIPNTENLDLYDLKLNQSAKVFGYRDTSLSFLEYIAKLNLLIGNSIKITSILSYENSVEVVISEKQSFVLSKELAQKIYIKIDGNHQN